MSGAFFMPVQWQHDIRNYISFIWYDDPPKIAGHYTSICREKLYEEK